MQIAFRSRRRFCSTLCIVVHYIFSIQELHVGFMDMMRCTVYRSVLHSIHGLHMISGPVGGAAVCETVVAEGERIGAPEGSPGARGHQPQGYCSDVAGIQLVYILYIL